MTFWKQVVRKWSGPAALAGGALLLAGLVVHSLRNKWDVASLVPVGLGGLLLIAGAVLNFTWITMMACERRVRAGANAFIYGLLLVLVWGMVNWINARHHKRFDVTFSKQFSISSQTRAVLGDLKKPLHVTAVMRPRQMLEFEVRDLLDEYASTSRLVIMRFIDAERDRAEAERLARRLKSDLELDSVVFEYGDKSKHVRRSDMEEIDFAAYQYGAQSPPKFKAEEAFTSAIMELVQERRTVSYFVTGHGERSSEGYDPRSLTGASGLLKRNNVEVKTLELLGAKKVPEDCGVLIIAGPAKRFTEHDITVIDEYLGSGGKCLVTLDPMADTGLENLLKKWGVEAGANAVIDPASSIPLVGPTTLFLGNYPPHDITAPLKGIATVFSLARTAEPGTVEKAGLTAESLARTSSESWAETDLENPEARYDEGKDKKGPLSIAVAVGPTRPEPPRPGMPPPPPQPSDVKTRLVVIGDTDFISDGQIGNPGNGDFFMNCMNWLAEREKMISISPRSPDLRQITMSGEQSAIVFSLVLVVLPLGALVAGGLVWWRRRK